MTTDQSPTTTLSRQLVEFYDKISSWEHSVVRGSSLSPAQMHTIEVIGHKQELRMKELAQRLGITTGTLTVGIDKLEKRRLVLRKPHKHDRRSWLISLTEEGKEVFVRHDRLHNEFTAEISADLKTDELRQFSVLLGKILRKM